MRSGIATCLAIYDWNGDISVAAFHDVARMFFADNGVSPDLATASNTPYDSTPRQYANVISTLSQQSPKIVELFHTIDGYKQLVFGWDVCALLNTYDNKTMIFCCAQNLAACGIAYFDGIVRTLAKHVQLVYGIGYQRDFEFGPEMYADGMASGLGFSAVEMAEADRIGAWMRERLNAKRHLQGFLRDVYPLNILSTVHLSRKVEGDSLRQWISRNSGRGELTQLESESWLWNVPESCLVNVQLKLQNAGCTILAPRAETSKQ